MTHTPGPWTIPDWRQLGKIDVVADTVKVAAVYLQPDKNIKRGWPTEEANARLIAAAPELLESLTKLVNGMGGLGSADVMAHRADIPIVWVQEALTAIGKATKEEL